MTRAMMGVCNDGLSAVGTAPHTSSSSSAVGGALPPALVSALEPVALRDAFSRCHRRWCETDMRATKQDAATSKQTTLRESSYGG